MRARLQRHTEDAPLAPLPDTATARYVDLNRAVIALILARLDDDEQRTDELLDGLDADAARQTLRHVASSVAAAYKDLYGEPLARCEVAHLALQLAGNST